MKFFYFPYACSLAAHVALEEIGQPFEAVLVDLRGGEQFDAAYRAINPSARVPALQLDSGEVLSENLAILYWLAETHPGAGLWPEGSLEKTRALEWMSWLASNVHFSGRLIWKGDQYANSPEAAEFLKTSQRARYQELLAQAEARIGDGPWVMGERYTVVDAHLLPFVRWPQVWKLDISACPKLLAWHQRMIERPAVLRALAREGQRP
ncbi:MAG TPA: glutathione binding-like protein [Rhodocyclaceae bacterium]|nr:glutathione binding-like protein [Rhodocyclaceae bacterium]